MNSKDRSAAQRSVLITGSGHGMGRELTRRAVARGDQVFATMMPDDDHSIGGGASNLLILDLDVTSTTAVEAMFESIDRHLAGRNLDLVIHCAGIAPSGALEVEPIATLERTLDVNAVGTARILKYALPRLRGHYGRIILFASLWGKVAGPMLSAYCASKHAIEAIVDSTRRELHGQAIDIILIEPGVVRTNMVAATVTGSRAGADTLPVADRPIYGALYDKFAAMIARESSGGVSVEEAADVIEAAACAAKPKTRYRIGKDAKAVVGLASILSDRAFDAIFRKMLDKR